MLVSARCTVTRLCKQSDCLGFKSVFFVMGGIVRFVHVNDNAFHITDIWLYYYCCCCCCCYYYYYCYYCYCCCCCCCYYYCYYYYWYTSTATVLGTLQ